MTAATFDVVTVAAPSTSLVTFSDPVAAQWRSILNVPGNFSATIPYDSTADSNLTLGKVLRVKLDATVAAHYLIEKRVDKLVQRNGEVDQNPEISGRSIDAVTDRLAVMPVLGFDRKPFADSRVFSFADPNYTPSGWTVPTVIVATPLTDSAHWTGLPAGFWGLGEPWIGPSTGTDDQAPSGYCYMIYDFTLADDSPIVFALGADNRAQTFIDGFELARIDPNDDPEQGYRTTTTASCFLSAGDHRFAVKLINDAGFAGEDPGFGSGPSVSGNPTGFIMSAWVYSGGGQLIGRSFGTADYADWLILEYPSTPPGFTFGQVVAQIVAENTGVDVTLTVDQTTADTTVLEAVTCQIGDSLLKVLGDGVQSGYCDWAVQVASGLTLKLWAYGSRGTTSGVTYAQTTDPATSTLAALELSQEDVGTDAYIVRHKDGQILVPDTGGTRVGYLKLDAATPAEAKTVAAQVVANSAQPRQVDADVEPTGTGDVPWLNVALGDSVAFDPLVGATVTERVQTLDGSLGDGFVEFKVTVQDLNLDEQDRLALKVQHLANGAAGGIAPAAPASPAPKFSGSASGSGERIQIDDNATLPVESPVLLLQSSRNLYAVAAVISTVGATDTTFEWRVDGVDVISGFGLIPAGDLQAIIPIPDPAPGGQYKTIWCEGNKTLETAYFSDLGGATGLVLEARFI